MSDNITPARRNSLPNNHAKGALFGYAGQNLWIEQSFDLPPTSEKGDDR